MFYEQKDIKSDKSVYCLIKLHYVFVCGKKILKRFNA
jgi:hypothetical protein